MIIDCHTHVFPPRIREERSRYASNDPTFALIYSDKKAKLATAEKLIAAMDEDGVENSVIANYGWATPELCTETNNYIMESVARYPHRLTGFGSFSGDSLESAIAEIERCARGGCRGIGELRPDLQSLDLSGEEIAQPFAETLRKHKLVLMTHSSEPAGHAYPGKGTVTPDLLYSLISRLPGVNIICAHWGGGLPFYALMPEINKELANVYFDTAASPFLYKPQVYVKVSHLVGADRVLFGSDYPLMPQRRVMSEIVSTELTDEEKGKILGGNAQRLLGIGA